MPRTAKKPEPQTKAQVANIQDKRSKKEQAEIAKLQAELDLVKATVEGLRAQIAKADAPDVRKAWTTPIATDKMAPADTMLGKAQRMERDDLLEALYKAVRNVRYADAPALLEKLVQQASENGGIDGTKTQDKLWEEFTTKRKYTRSAK